MQMKQVKEDMENNTIKTITLRYPKKQFDELKLIKDDEPKETTWEGIVSKAMKNYEATKPT